MLTVDFQAMLDLKPCSQCHGARLRQESLHVYLIPESRAKDKETQLFPLDKIDEKYNIYDLQSMPMEEMEKVITRYKES